jgi:hypothetical protein
MVIVLLLFWNRFRRLPESFPEWFELEQLRLRNPVLWRRYIAYFCMKRDERNRRDLVSLKRLAILAALALAVLLLLFEALHVLS